MENKIGDTSSFVTIPMLHKKVRATESKIPNTSDLFNKKLILILNITHNFLKNIFNTKNIDTEMLYVADFIKN